MQIELKPAIYVAQMQWHMPIELGKNDPKKTTPGGDNWGFLLNFFIFTIAVALLSELQELILGI
jgi:hypothetical protein